MNVFKEIIITDGGFSVICALHRSLCKRPTQIVHFLSCFSNFAPCNHTNLQIDPHKLVSS